MAYFSPEDTGPHAITVTMYECRLEPCYFALGVMALDDADTGGFGFGTCFTVTPDGHVMTARHVVEADQPVRVHFSDGTSALAEVEVLAADHDLALLATGTPRFDYLTFADPDQLRLGTDVFTLGFPAPDILGREPKYTQGVISALSGPNDGEDLLQMSVPIQPGNSGGPLVTLAGEVLGVVSSTAGFRAFEAWTGALPQNVNWAVKGQAATELVDTPPPPWSTTMPEEAIDRAYGAVCLVEVGEAPDEVTAADPGSGR